MNAKGALMLSQLAIKNKIKKVQDDIHVAAKAGLFTVEVEYNSHIMKTTLEDKFREDGFQVRKLGDQNVLEIAW